MFNIVFVEPEIPQNTGSTARLCAATGAALHLVEPLGFDTDERAVRRAGLDYWRNVSVTTHKTFGALRAAAGPDARFFFYTSGSGRLYTEVQYRAGDWLVFGRESVGLPRELLAENSESRLRIPILPAVRSLNLATSAGIVLYEALRQSDFKLK